MQPMPKIGDEGTRDASSDRVKTPAALLRLCRAGRGRGLLKGTSGWWFCARENRLSRTRRRGDATRVEAELQTEEPGSPSSSNYGCRNRNPEIRLGGYQGQVGDDRFGLTQTCPPRGGDIKTEALARRGKRHETGECRMVDVQGGKRQNKTSLPC